ncbi:MAG: hypothetical protein ACXACY_24325, partial [Candidatus Hodarchaeales archaeon]
MVRRYEITASPPRNEDKIGLPAATPKATPKAWFPKDGGAVSPAEMSGFFLSKMVFRHREESNAVRRRSDLLHLLKLWDCFAPTKVGARNDVFVFLPGAA